MKRLLFLLLLTLGCTTPVEPVIDEPVVPPPPVVVKDSVTIVVCYQQRPSYAAKDRPVYVCPQKSYNGGTCYASIDLGDCDTIRPQLGDTVLVKYPIWREVVGGPVYYKVMESMIARKDTTWVL